MTFVTLSLPKNHQSLTTTTNWPLALDELMSELIPLSERADPTAIEAMFSDISGRYDLLNSVMSLGRDQFWRDCLSGRLLVLRSPGLFLDLATGTGDQLLSIKKYRPNSLIIGLDLSKPMLKIAEEKLQTAVNKKVIQKPLPTLIQGDAVNYDFPEGSFDSISISFGLRNIADKKALYDSILHHLTPGGRFLILELFTDSRSFLAPFHRWHLKSFIPFMASRIFHCSSEAYSYLGDSILEFPHPENLIDDLLKAGFVDLGYQTYTFGAVMVVWGHKPLNRPLSLGMG
jgi:demethylmenaquinone methyltransferase/2-methoxy-6-polyprenyl-1,4-benzoquinol methylase